MAVELGQCGEKQSSRSAGSDGLCSHPASALVHGMPGLCTDWAGTSKGLRGAGSQFTLLGQQPKSLGRNVPGGGGDGGGLLWEKGVWLFFYDCG